MKRLQIITLSASIFAIAGFGLSQWANVFHKANQAHLPQNLANAVSNLRNLIEKTELGLVNALWNLTPGQWLVGLEDLGVLAGIILILKIRDMMARVRRD